METNAKHERDNCESLVEDMALKEISIDCNGSKCNQFIIQNPQNTKDHNEIKIKFDPIQKESWNNDYKQMEI